MIDCSASYSASQAARQWFGRLVYGIVAAGWMTGSAYAASESEKITIKGIVPLSCSFSDFPGGSVDFGNLSKARKPTINFEVGCSGGFDVKMTSDKGGLKHTSSKQVAGFAIKHPYKATFEVENNAGVAVKGTCTSPNMKKGACSEISSADPAMPKNATVTFKLGKKPQNPLVAGTYKDTYTITLSPQG
jgi:hypothetical protein